jgi:hypothetical protein
MLSVASQEDWIGYPRVFCQAISCCSISRVALRLTAGEMLQVPGLKVAGGPKR